MSPRQLVEKRDFLEFAGRAHLRNLTGLTEPRQGFWERGQGLQSHPELTEELRQTLDDLHDDNLVRYGLGLAAFRKLYGAS